MHNNQVYSELDSENIKPRKWWHPRRVAIISICFIVVIIFVVSLSLVLKFVIFAPKNPETTTATPPPLVTTTISTPPPSITTTISTPSLPTTITSLTTATSSLPTTTTASQTTSQPITTMTTSQQGAPYINRFPDQVTYSTGSGPYSVAAADFNGDNNIDFIAVNYALNNNLNVLWNTGNGTFPSHNSYSTGFDSGQHSVVIADVNGDTKPDIIVANRGVSNVRVLLNIGNGKFVAQVTYLTGSGSQPISMAAADVNGDSKPDIIVANYGANNVGVFLNTGNGTFAAQISYSTGSGSQPISVAAADVNGDNRLDIIVATYGLNNVGVLLNTGNGTFAAEVTYSTDSNPDSEPYSVAAADVNGDSKPDIIVANYGGNHVGVLLNTGNGTFSAQITYSTGSGSQPISVAAADVNGDNQLDIIVANYGGNNVGVLLNTGNGTFAAEITYSTGSGSQPISVAAADVNGDNQLDIIVANYGVNNVGVLLNTGNGTFATQVTYSISTASNPKSVTAADVNGDSKVDIIVANSGTSNVGVLLNTGNGTFAAEVTYSTGSRIQSISVAAADVNGDSQLDIIVANHAASTVGVLLNTGNGTFVAQVTYSTGSAYSVAAADVNGDSKVDIVVANRGGNTVGVLLNTGNGTFAAHVSYSAGSQPMSVAAADVNGDSKPDIIVANYGANNVGVLLNTGNGTFAAQITYSTGFGSQPMSVVAADVNGDSKPDIIVANYGANNVGVFLNTGNGTFTAQITYSTGSGSQPISVAAANVNGDNKLDIIVANYRGNTVGVLLNIGNGMFAAEVTYSTGSGSQPSSVTAADVNGDSKLDIIVANHGGNNVGVFLSGC